MNKGQQTGMRGVYLTAARLAEEGFIVSPTSRSARGADLLVTDPECRKAFSVQVKTNARTFGFFLVGKHAASVKSSSHIFVLVNIRPKETEFFVIPSRKVSALVKTYKAKTNSQWWFIKREDAAPYRDRWRCFDPLR